MIKNYFVIMLSVLMLGSAPSFAGGALAITFTDERDVEVPVSLLRQVAKSDSSGKIWPGKYQFVTSRRTANKEKSVTRFSRMVLDYQTNSDKFRDDSPDTLLLFSWNAKMEEWVYLLPDASIVIISPVTKSSKVRITGVDDQGWISPASATNPPAEQNKKQSRYKKENS